MLLMLVRAPGVDPECSILRYQLGGPGYSMFDVT